MECSVQNKSTVVKKKKDSRLKLGTCSVLVSRENKAETFHSIFFFFTLFLSKKAQAFLATQ